MFKSSENIIKITMLGLIVNLSLSILKMIGGHLGHSQAVFADGIHSLSDTVTDIVILIGVNFWSKPPDLCHPYGHKRIETFITAFIGIILGLVAIRLIYNSIVSIFYPQPSTPDFIAFFAALISILLNEALFRATFLVGKKCQSSAVIANAWHHRSDALSSIPAVLAVATTMAFPKLYYIDSIGAIIVSFFILKVACNIINPAFAELTDKGASPELYKNINKIAYATDGIIGVHRCRTRFTSSKLQLDLHIVVDKNLTVKESDKIYRNLENKLYDEIPILDDILIRIEPNS